MNTQDSAGAVRSQFNDRFQAIQERVGETARNVSRTTDEYVHENPWTTVGIVAAAALVIGFLLGSQRD
jgi:ElaB/YqjD/DUF883 family membrane-anchored ribosome-binding protein